MTKVLVAVVMKVANTAVVEVEEAAMVVVVETKRTSREL